jgi:hypothetical protein
MSTTQAFLLGMMVSWTPSLLLLGWMLLHHADLKDEANGVQH